VLVIAAAAAPQIRRMERHPSRHERYAILHSAPIALFPVSRQDTGSSVFALPHSSLVLGLGPLRDARAHEVSAPSALIAAIALVVDVYLY
jgi:hypothetical protein